MKLKLKPVKHNASNPLYSHVSRTASFLGMLLLCLAASPTEAASSLTNSLTGYTGTSQDNYPAQPAFLAGSELEVSFVWGGGDGAWEKIGFDSSGAAFGAYHGGSDGRNYLRTLDNNYAPVSFSAFVTVNRTTRQSVFFGMGNGNLGSYKAPDIGSGNASVFLELQEGWDNGSRRVLGGTPSAPSNVEVGYNGLTTVTGLMRLRMDYDASAKTVIYSVDYNPSGGFVADQTFPAIDVSSIAPEWAAGEKSSIYFGGQGNMIFTDFLVVVAVAPPGGLDHFVVSASSPQTAGTAFDVMIIAQDVGNATVIDSTTTVTINSPGGSLMEFDWNSDGIYGDNSGTLVAGEKTIKARNKKAETATVVALGGIATTTTPPDVTTTADVFTRLQILAPGETANPGTATGKTGTPRNRLVNRGFNITVNAVDTYWNLVNTVYDTVGITSTDSTATLPADTMLIEGTNTFAVTLNTNGRFTLAATNVTDINVASGNVTVTASPLLAATGTWKPLPIQYGQTPNINGWNAVPVASITNSQGTASWDVKHIKVCNDATNLYFLVELWPGSSVTLVSGNVVNNFWFDSDNNPETGYANAGDTGVGAEDLLNVWQVWDGNVRQALWWGVTANFSPNADARGPGGNPFGGWQADNGLYYEYSMALAATNTDGSAVFATNSVTIGFGSSLNGTLGNVIPAFSYTFATEPVNLVAVRISGGGLTFDVTKSSGTYVVEVNTSLANPAGWTPVYTNSAPFTFTDPTPVSAHTSRFYRTVSQ